MALVAELSLTSFKTILLDSVVTAVISVCIFKKLTKICEYLCSHLNIEDGEKNIFGILYFIISRKVKMQLKHKKRFLSCLEKVLWLIECVKWFVKFRAGDFSLDDAPWSGRPAEVDSNQMETLIENNQHYTMWEIADILKISKSTKLLMKMKKMCLLFYRKK